MAIRGIVNRDRRKVEEGENSNSSERSLVLPLSTNFTDKPVPQDENARHNSKDAITIPEVFDSSKYNSMTEMNELANMKEGDHLKEVLSNVEKEEPIKPTTMDTESSSMDIDSSLAAMTAADVDARPPSLLMERSMLGRKILKEIMEKTLT